MNIQRVSDLLYQALQTEQDTARVYETAIRCAVDDALKEEWARSLSETRQHEENLVEVFDTLGLDPQGSTAGRQSVRHIGHSLMETMEEALNNGPSDEAQLVACECAAYAESKDRLNWQLLREVAGRLKDEEAEALTRACEEVAEQEAEHRHDSSSWARELWRHSLGVPAELPPAPGALPAPASEDSDARRHETR